MPIYDPDHVEYRISHGHVQLVLDGGKRLPAYWAHPTLGRKFPAVALVHDWWGLTDNMRRLANLFAQMGYYVIVPDLFNGKVAQNPAEAMALVKGLVDHGYPVMDQALHILENHHQVNKSVAAVGLGMGGSLAFEAAITRPDLEAAVAYGGFPQRYFGKFHASNTPIYAFYGEREPYMDNATLKRLHHELATSQLGTEHHVEVVPGLGHDVFAASNNHTQRHHGREVLKKTFNFLDQHLERPSRPTRQVY